MEAARTDIVARLRIAVQGKAIIAKLLFRASTLRSDF
jgi:hypothetical protein